MGFGFDFMFNIFPFLFMIIFFMVIAVFAVAFFKGVKTFNNNNHSPELTVTATVTSKREHMSHRSHDDDFTTNTSYYATFEVESGDRMEFNISGHEYGMLLEGDYGNLTFKGTRYIRFERL